MKKVLIYVALCSFLISGVTACKAKHCTVYDDSMEGYKAKKARKKKGRQEGLFDNKVKR